MPLVESTKTLYQAMHDQLIAHGMWPNDATKVLELAKEDKRLEPMKNRWNERQVTIAEAATWLTVKRLGLDFIKANCPQAFYRCMFEE